MLVNLKTAKVLGLTVPLILLARADDEVHLRQILQSYVRYYNDIRTHRSLDKDAPVSRQIQRIGSIKSHAILDGLHHHYARA